MSYSAHSRESEAHHLLDQMGRAFKELNYEGVMIHGGESQWNTLSIQHAVVDGIEYEKLVHLTGEPFEFIRREHDIHCLHPGDHARQFENANANPLNQSTQISSGNISDTYSLSLVDSQRIAGRIAKRVDVLPKDRNRFGHRLWLDEQTGLLLRSDMVSDRGIVLERFQFASVTIGEPVALEHFVPKNDAHKVSIDVPVHSNLPEIQPVLDMDHVRWMPTWLPTGFRFAGGHPYIEDLVQQPVMMTFTDGLAAFSLFIDASTSGLLTDMSRQWGGTSAVVRHMAYHDQSIRVTVVGELPTDTLKRIAHSVVSTQTMADLDSNTEAPL